jgi:hypothetical protein
MNRAAAAEMIFCRRRLVGGAPITAAFEKTRIDFLQARRSLSSLSTRIGTALVMGAREESRRGVRGSVVRAGATYILMRVRMVVLLKLIVVI